MPKVEIDVDQILTCAVALRVEPGDKLAVWNGAIVGIAQKAAALIAHEVVAPEVAPEVAPVGDAPVGNEPIVGDWGTSVMAPTPPATTPAKAAAPVKVKAASEKAEVVKTDDRPRPTEADLLKLFHAQGMLTARTISKTLVGGTRWDKSIANALLQRAKRQEKVRVVPADEGNMFPRYELNIAREMHHVPTPVEQAMALVNNTVAGMQ